MPCGCRQRRASSSIDGTDELMLLAPDDLRAAGDALGEGVDVANPQALWAFWRRRRAS